MPPLYLAGIDDDIAQRHDRDPATAEVPRALTFPARGLVHVDVLPSLTLTATSPAATAEPTMIPPTSLAELPSTRLKPSSVTQPVAAHTDQADGWILWQAQPQRPSFLDTELTAVETW